MIHDVRFFAPQIHWIGQLVESEVKFAMHIDGKHKLHHGKWILVTIGVHDLSLNKDRKMITHSYRPLVYMFSKQHETAESVKLLCDSLEWVAVQYFGRQLNPLVMLMDHSDGFRGGVTAVWPNIGAYPDVSRNVERIVISTRDSNLQRI